MYVVLSRRLHSLGITVTTTQVLDLSFCELGLYSLTWDQVSEITQLVHAAVMCMLVIIQFTRQSLQMYTVTKQWRLNQFMNLLVMEGVLYFLMYVFISSCLASSHPPFHKTNGTNEESMIFRDSVLLWDLVSILVAWGKVSIAGWQTIPISIMEAVPMATLPPRFIMGLRELYARNVQERDGSGIDSGFGLSTLPSHGASISVMLFSDARQDGGLEHCEEIPMEEEIT